MKIIISPAKKMNDLGDETGKMTVPVFLEDARFLRERLKEMDLQQQRELWSCNEKIAQENRKRLEELSVDVHQTPAVLAYEGIQYQYMAPQVFTDSQWEYVQENLRILSGLYGILKPLDGIIPYRLEMQAKLAVAGTSNLYEYWGERICRELVKEGGTVINLASKEYSRTVEKYLGTEYPLITCVFGEYTEGKVKVKATLAKMARGEMVRYLAQEKVHTPEQLKDFTGLGFAFCPKLSDERKYTFLLEKKTEDQ